MDPVSRGEPRQGAAYRPRTGWRPGWAVVAVFAILAAAVAGAQATQLVFDRLGWTEASWLVLGALAVSQIIAIALTWGAAGQFGVSARRTLSLDPPANGPIAYLGSFAALVAAFGTLSAIAWLVAPEIVTQDLRVFSGLIRSDAWWLAVLVMGLGAPLMEELLFRGFLFSALAKSRIGAAGAALVTTAGWTALHAGYSALGLAEVFAIGLYFSWILWRTGSLRVPIFCHAAYNTLVVLILLFVDIPAAAPA